MSPAAYFIVLRHQARVEDAFEALSTITDVTVSCDGAALCGLQTASTCTVEFLTELGDVPIISHSVSNVDSVTITEFQVSPRESGEWLGCADLRERREGGQRGHNRLRLTALFSTKGMIYQALLWCPPASGFLLCAHLTLYSSPPPIQCAPMHSRKELRSGRSAAIRACATTPRERASVSPDTEAATARTTRARSATAGGCWYCHSFLPG